MTCDMPWNDKGHVAVLVGMPRGGGVGNGQCKTPVAVQKQMLKTLHRNNIDAAACSTLCRSSVNKG